MALTPGCARPTLRAQLSLAPWEEHKEGGHLQVRRGSAGNRTGVSWRDTNGRGWRGAGRITCPGQTDVSAH